MAAPLKSLGDVIAQYHPYIKAEVYTKLTSDQGEQLLNFLLERGYQIHKVTKEAMQGPKLAVADTMKWRTYDIFCTP